MGWLQGAGQVADGPPTHVEGIRALALVGGPAGARIVSTTGWQGGLVLRDAATRDLLETASLTRPPGQQGDPALTVLTLGGREALVLHGLGGDARLWWTDGAGGPGGAGSAPGDLLSYPQALDFGGQTITAVSAMELPGGGDALYTTALQSPAITQWLRDAQGLLRPVAQIAVDSGSTTTPPVLPLASGAEIVAPRVFSTAAGDWLVAAESRGASLSLWQLDAGGAATPAGRLTAAEGLAAGRPSQLAIARSGGQDFILLGAAGSGSLTVVELTPAGDLVIRDHVIDDRATRMAGLSVLEVAQAGDFTLVLAGGADDGLTLMALLPSGRLVHLDTVDAGISPALMNPLALVVHESGGALLVDIAGEGAAGQGRLVLPLAGPGALLQADAGGGTLVGTAGRDILVGGPGADVLQGGAGADVFVPGSGSGGGEDVILDFTPGEDVIDLSAWGRIRDPAALVITRRGEGVEIRHGDARLQVLPGTGPPLQPGDFDAGNLLGLDHVPIIPATPWQPPPAGPDWPLLPHLPGPGRLFAGTPGDDTVAGTSGDDVMFGGGGRDRLSGGAGDDLIFGEGVSERFDSVAGQVVRFSALVLGRAPDGAGLADWRGRLLAPGGDSGGDSGGDLAQVVRGFIDSPEFRAAVAPGSAGFVTALLENLGGAAPDSAPDPAQVSAGVAQLAAGMPREEFVLSLLGDAGLAREVIGTAWHHSAAGREAAAAPLAFRLLLAVTGDAPEAAALDQARAALAAGSSPGEVVGAFLGPGHALQPGQGSNPDFVTRAYEALLGRAPDEAGLADWSARLRAGAERADIVAGIAGSAEFADRTAPALKDWMRAQGLDDRLEGGPGDNILAGGIGADVFVFARDDGGVQRVLDLEPWDFVELRGFGHAGGEDALARITRRGEDAVLVDQGVEIIFHHVDAASLTADMFLMV